jgi:retron-type reverse transcriptase
MSNLMLDVLDKELEKRGHHFVRYADDCNIYVRSQRADERVMTTRRKARLPRHRCGNSWASASQAGLTPSGALRRRR